MKRRLILLATALVATIGLALPAAASASTAHPATASHPYSIIGD